MQENAQADRLAESEECPKKILRHPTSSDTAEIPSESKNQDQPGCKEAEPVAIPIVLASPSILSPKAGIRSRSLIRRRVPEPTLAQPRARGSGTADPRSARSRA